MMLRLPLNCLTGIVSEFVLSQHESERLREGDKNRGVTENTIEITQISYFSGWYFSRAGSSVSSDPAVSYKLTPQMTPLIAKSN